MDKNYDYPPFYGYGMAGSTPEMDDMYFNPMMQYEQGYMYYRFLCQQLEYKMKLKEYEKQNKERRVE